MRDLPKFLLLLAALGVAIAAYVFLHSATTSNPQSADGLRSLQPNDGTKTTVDILFIGNSYTFVNDLPGMLLYVAASDPMSPYRFEVQSITQGGAHLVDFLKSKPALQILASRRWTYVVLQEQSEWAVVPGQAASTFKAVEIWNKLIRTDGATPVFYQTWARQPGSGWYTDRRYRNEDMQNPEHMQYMIDTQTRYVATVNNISIIPVGDIWAIAEAMPGAPNLYLKDGSHPSLAGTYLTALVFYRALSGDVETDVRYAPPDFSASTVELLKAAAAK